MTKKDQFNNEAEEVLSRFSVAFFGFDTTKLNPIDKQAAEESALRRFELEDVLQRRKESDREQTEAEKIEKRREALIWAKLNMIGGGKALKEMSNEQLEEQLKILRSLVGNR